MRQELLKLMTPDDIAEIIEAHEFLRLDTDATPDEILNFLLEKDGCPPTIGARFSSVMSAAEQAVGRKLSKERSKDNTLIRAFVAHRLRGEGYTYNDIGKMIQRDHSSVIHMCKIVRDMLSVPYAYREEMAMYRDFETQLGQLRQ